MTIPEMVQYIKKKLPRRKNSKRSNKFYLSIKEPENQTVQPKI